MKLNYIRKLQERFFLLGVLTLPIYQTINHWFFGIFLGISFILIYLSKQQIIIKKNRFILLLVASFFLIKLFGIFQASSFNYGLKEALRALPFLLYPIAILSLKNKHFVFKKFEKRAFYSLAYGSLITAIICWGYIIVSLKKNDIPANTLFGWKKSGIYLTQILDVHPPYLGMLLVASILFLIKEVFYNSAITKNKKYSNIFISLILFVFLFNITARNALLFLVAFSMLFLIYNKYWKLLLIPLASIAIIGIIIVKHPSQYYRLKMYNMLNLSDSNIKDKRFERLKASFEVFKTSPLIGVGDGNDNNLRALQYQINNDKIAFEKRLNSHNQLFEYLVAHGLIGGLIFIGVNLFLLRFLIKNRQYFYLILLCNFLIATLTESVFERVLGIQYFSIIISLAVLATVDYQEKTKKINL